MITFAGDITQDSSETMKENWKPGTLIYPLPAVLVSCGATPDEYNLLTVAWTGTVCTNPPDVLHSRSARSGTPTTSSAARVNSSSTSPPKSWHALRTGAAYVLAATTTNFGKRDLLRFGDRRQGSRRSRSSPVDRMPRTTDPTVRIARPVSGRSGEYPGRQPLHRLRNG